MVGIVGGRGRDERNVNTRRTNPPLQEHKDTVNLLKLDGFHGTSAVVGEEKRGGDTEKEYFDLNGKVCIIQIRANCYFFQLKYKFVVAIVFQTKIQILPQPPPPFELVT